jgi:hypothetical protein
MNLLKTEEMKTSATETRKQNRKKKTAQKWEKLHSQSKKKSAEAAKEQQYEMHVQLLQPWSVPVMKLQLPPDILQIMIEISDKIIVDKEAKKWGTSLVGQIDKELYIPIKTLIEKKVLGFFQDAIRQFVITCLSQASPSTMKHTQQEEWLIEILVMWIVSQQPGEYNPMHIHTECQISTVMYLKVPEMLPSRKRHRADDDGAILFTSNSSRDLELSVPTILLPPVVGDFYIFGAHQQHAVYPFRCAKGQEDVERRSISFNAVFQSKTSYEAAMEKSSHSIVNSGTSFDNKI